ncbi:hypothetical protein FXO38_00020 [Capsicum annuum]|nr:hypothetical protein FXO38_00020 [Capsicum annuum]KAF3686048.1 hypothetical protein FXO37_00010 [Capsicum annuum]
MERGKTSYQLLSKVSTTSKKRGAISGLGVFMVHLTPGVPITVVSSIKKGIPRGILAERYNTSWLACLHIAIKNMFDAASRSRVFSTLVITDDGKALDTSFESGKRCKWLRTVISGALSAEDMYNQAAHELLSGVNPKSVLAQGGSH